MHTCTFFFPLCFSFLLHFTFFFYLSLFLSFFFTTCALLIGVFKLVCISIWEGVLAQSFVHVPILLCTRDTCMTFITCTCHVMCSFPLRQLTQISRSKDQTAEDNRNNYILQLEATNEFRNTHYTQRMPNLMDVSDTPPRYVYNVVRFFWLRIASFSKIHKIMWYYQWHVQSFELISGSMASYAIV